MKEVLRIASPRQIPCVLARLCGLCLSAHHEEQAAQIGLHLGRVRRQLSGGLCFSQRLREFVLVEERGSKVSVRLRRRQRQVEVALKDENATGDDSDRWY